jgi:hypothetical protein
MSFFGWTSRGTLVLASISLLACGSVNGPGPGPGGDDDAPPPPPTGDFTITVNPTSLTIPIAGSQTVTVTIARTGTIGDVMLSGADLGSSITATFAPNPIPAGATTSQATITIAGGSAAAATTINLTGTAGTVQHSATVSVTSTTITVTGTVRGGRSGVKVGIIGKQSVTSGAGGVFMFSDVTPPYDLYTFADSGSTSSPTPTVFLFDDLTRPDPIVSAPATATLTAFLLCGIVSPCPSSAITGTKTGTGTNTDEVVYAWTNGSFTGALAANGTYSGTISWSSGNTNQGNLHAIQLTRRPSGAPNTFLGYAKSGQVTLTDGTPATINLAFTAVNSTATLTGTVTGPTGYPGPTISLMQQFGSTQQPLWRTDQTTTVDATFPLVAAAGGTSLFATASLNGGTSSFVQPLTTSVAVSFAMPAAAVLAMPADAATGVTASTHFTWTSAASTINELNVSTSTPNRAAYKIFTTASDVTIPVVPELALPANQSFSWRVVAYGPNATIDEAAAANELEGVSQADFAGPAHAQTLTAFRTFTSAP